MLRGTTAFLVVPIAVAATFAQQPSPAAPPSQLSPVSSGPVTTLNTVVRQVILDLIVTDQNGHTVKGLKQSDIILKEDKVPQELVRFSEQDSDSEPAPVLPAPLPPNTFEDHAPITGDRPITAILFDELSFVNATDARDQLSAYIKSISPGTPISIFKLDSEGLHLIQDFTNDPRVLGNAIEIKRNEQILHSPYYTQRADPRLSAVQRLATYLSGFTGRKNLISLTGGAAPYIPKGPERDPSR